jgi:tetraprenyl-beta-curcumene synthase
MKRQTARRLTQALAFANAAQTYWLKIWPGLSRELRGWGRRAERIPDEPLKHHALTALDAKRGNVEGAAAFGILGQPSQRRAAVRAMAAYQAIFDYLDCLAEQPHADPIANGRQLNQALLLAVQPGAGHTDYYSLHSDRDDGGYLAMLVDRCRDTLARLPSYPPVHGAVVRAATRIATYQSLNHGNAEGSHEAFARWTAEEAERHWQAYGEFLNWWEIGAACGSSLGVFALIAAATRPSISPQEVVAIERAYFPWIGAANSLLDSLIDQDEDAEPGQHLLLDYYASPAEAVERFDYISHEAARHAGELPPRYGHTLILAAMIGFYLSHPQADAPELQPIRDSVVDSVKEFALPTLIVMRSRRAAARLNRCRRRAFRSGAHRR